jgi:glutamine amidotransferase
MIALIDYGMGNLRSVAKAIEALGGEVRITEDPAVVRQADKVILPGVGAFPAAMHELATRGLVPALRESIAAGKPYLGICLGLQLLFETSEEAGGAAGLGILAGRVRRFPDAAAGQRLVVPHMGWNRVRPLPGKRMPELLQGIAPDSYFYFVHSYFVEPAVQEDAVLVSDYGLPFTAMVQRGRLFATQFHPEKSQAVGLCLLQNFIAL